MHAQSILVRPLIVVAILALCLGVPAVPGQADPPQRIEEPIPGAASTETPFRASFEVTTSLTPDLACGGFHLSGTGTGRATHLGATTITVDECVDFLMEPGRVHVYGSFVLTAANGDQLHVSVDKAGELPGPTGDAHVTGPYEVTGGTGRFVVATGSGITSTDANVFSPDAMVDLVGTLRRR